jgi:uncharacterized CHY-type Zn-finger protein
LKKENKALNKALEEIKIKIIKIKNKQQNNINTVITGECINSEILKDFISVTSCIICNSKIKTILYGDCKHLVACTDCGKNLDEICPICRKKSRKIKIYP